MSQEELMPIRERTAEYNEDGLLTSLTVEQRLRAGLVMPDEFDISSCVFPPEGEQN